MITLHFDESGAMDNAAKFILIDIWNYAFVIYAIGYPQD